MVRVLPRSFQLTWKYTKKAAVQVQYNEGPGTLPLNHVSFHNVLFLPD